MQKGVMEEIFVSAVKMLKAKGCIKLENYFIEGTKNESAAGRYTFVWKKAVETKDQRLDEKLRGYIRMAEDIWEDENREYGEKDLEELGGKDGFTSRDVKELAGALRERASSRSSMPRMALKSARGMRVCRPCPLSIGQAYPPDGPP
jgi:hypothetical protein